MVLEIDPEGPFPARFAVAIIVLRQNDMVEGGWEAVLVARKDDHTRWSLPGGKVDRGETSPEAAVRELAEETGISLLSLSRGLGLTVGQAAVYATRRLIPQGTLFDSGGYLTTFYLLDTTGMTLPETFEVDDHEAPVEWGPIHRLLDGPYGYENAERFKKIGILK